MIPNNVKDIGADHISVCICTFKRPELLSKTLDNVFSQITDSAFTFEVVVVDNDKLRSALKNRRRSIRKNLSTLRGIEDEYDNFLDRYCYKSIKFSFK